MCLRSSAPMDQHRFSLVIPERGQKLIALSIFGVSRTLSAPVIAECQPISSGMQKIASLAFQRQRVAVVHEWKVACGRRSTRLFEGGRHNRLAFGNPSLPSAMPVELELIFLLCPKERSVTP